MRPSHVSFVRAHGAEGVIFPQLADKVSAEFGTEIFGDEMMVVDGDYPNAVRWDHASREFLAVINMMLEHSGIRMVCTTAQRYYDHGAPVEIFHDRDGDECVPIPVAGNPEGVMMPSPALGTEHVRLERRPAPLSLEIRL